FRKPWEPHPRDGIILAVEGAPGIQIGRRDFLHIRVDHYCRKRPHIHEENKLQIFRRSGNTITTSRQQHKQSKWSNHVSKHLKECDCCSRQ
ncbi:hypothetical protein, partial [Pseudomonas aeruginosa]|uniref:hypothetical protein n=1 Tax=Pseudomonas aeruginosa TaxID=287 RepID=UPI0026F0A1FD